MWPNFKLFVEVIAGKIELPKCWRFDILAALISNDACGVL